MGSPQRHRIAQLAASVALAVMVMVAACSGGDIQASDMLLSPADFPDLDVTEISTQTDVTPLGVDAAQVELLGTDFALNQSVVVFATPESALTVLAGIKQDQLAEGVLPIYLEQFQDISGILTEARGSEARQTLFFVEGRVLVRLTTSGSSAPGQLEGYAAKAREKADGQ